MAFIRYIPRQKEVIDRRSPEGGYYEMTCDHCGGLFWPKRRSAMYCSHSCTMAAHRKIDKDNEVKLAGKKISARTKKKIHALSIAKRFASGGDIKKIDQQIKKLST